MGLEVFEISDKAAQLLVESDNNWTSVIAVQGYQRLNVGIKIGSAVSDILSAASFSATLSGIVSTCSCVFTLQRRMPEEQEDYHWRDVAEWSVLAADGEDASSENITDKPEPETVEYRLGVKTGDYESGTALLRIGTS